MVTLNSGTFSKMTVQYGLVPAPKDRLDVINPMAEKQKAKSLIPMTMKSGEIMWVHLNIVQDEQWETSKPKIKGNSCKVVSLVTDNNSVTVTSLSDSKGEKLALAVFGSGA